MTCELPAIPVENREFYDHLLIPHGAIESYYVVSIVVIQKTLPVARFVNVKESRYDFSLELSD